MAGKTVTAKYRFKGKDRRLDCEAFLFTGPWMGDDIPQWFTDAVNSNHVILHGGRKTESCTIKGYLFNDGDPVLREVRKGYYIVKDKTGEMHPYDAGRFKYQYEREP